LLSPSLAVEAGFGICVITGKREADIAIREYRYRVLDVFDVMRFEVDESIDLLAADAVFSTVAEHIEFVGAFVGTGFVGVEAADRDGGAGAGFTMPLIEVKDPLKGDEYPPQHFAESRLGTPPLASCASS
jgi:hypothetical protein